MASSTSRSSLCSPKAVSAKSLKQREYCGPRYLLPLRLSSSLPPNMRVAEQKAEIVLAVFSQCLLITVGPRKNASVIGELMAGRELNYGWLEEKAYMMDKDIVKIYPTEKRDWRAIKREALKKRKKMVRLHKTAKVSLPPRPHCRNLSTNTRTQVIPDLHPYLPTPGYDSFSTGKLRKTVYGNPLITHTRLY